MAIALLQANSPGVCAIVPVLAYTVINSNRRIRTSIKRSNRWEFLNEHRRLFIRPASCWYSYFAQ